MHAGALVVHVHGIAIKMKQAIYCWVIGSGCGAADRAPLTSPSVCSCRNSHSDQEGAAQHRLAAERLRLCRLLSMLPRLLVDAAAVVGHLCHLPAAFTAETLLGLSSQQLDCFLTTD